jgi:hypothetical protein
LIDNGVFTNIKEIEKTRRQTQDSDLQKFDERIKDMKSAAFTAAKEFVKLTLVTTFIKLQSSLL